MKNGLAAWKVKRRETLTLAQSAQEALDVERERFRSSVCLKEPDGLEKQEPTPDAVTVLLNEERRGKANYYRSRKVPPAFGDAGLGRR